MNNLIKFAVTRPITVLSSFIFIIFLGLMSYNKIKVDLFPDVNFPIVVVTTVYPGSGPVEVEQLISKPIEKEISTVSGIDLVKSINKENISIVIAKFSMSTDLKFATQQVKDRVAEIKNSLPKDIHEPRVKNVNPSDDPILTLSLTANLDEAKLYDIADNEILPLIEQIDGVGLVEIYGGRKREIQVNLDLEKLREYRLSATQVSKALEMSGKNVPAGKIDSDNTEFTIKTIGEFGSVKAIENTIVSFYGNENVIRIKDIATVEDTLADVKTKNYVNGNQALSFLVLKQSGANTIDIVKKVKKRLLKVNKNYQPRVENFKISIVQDGSTPIQANIDDVMETIIIGILLVGLVVYLFLGSWRSTLITGAAIPNSLIGSFSLILLAGFSLNLMSLLAMSLAVGLLIDDAIVVRENIFRHLKMGKSPLIASYEGTKEVAYAVLGVSLTILAVFMPVGFLDGMVGQFFKEFGLTVCFIIIISTLDALIMAPMMSTYVAKNNKPTKTSIFFYPLKKLTVWFDDFQTYLEKIYAKLLKLTLGYKKTALFICFSISCSSVFVLGFVPKLFVPPQDVGEFIVKISTDSGTTFNEMDKLALAIDKNLSNTKGIDKVVTTVGNKNGESNVARLYIKLVPKKQRTKNTFDFKDIVREKLSSGFPSVTYKFYEVGDIAEGEQPFQVAILGNNIKDVKKVAFELYEKLKNDPNLKDLDLNYKEGKPEFQVKVKRDRAEEYGISSTVIGQELRNLIEGSKPAVFRKNGNEYDIKVRLKEEQRDLKQNFADIYVPNLNNRLIRLDDIASPDNVEGPITTYRQNGRKYILVTADLNPNGEGLGAVMSKVQKLFESKEISTPFDISYEFSGEAERFEELATSMGLALILAIVLIFFVLACLYESFITPLSIMLVIPLAAGGAIYALAITGKSLDVFSVIGCILLLGIATKNSIILIDYIKQLVKKGYDNNSAILEACVVRLRPILMTAFALIGGMIPLAIGLNEASSQRTSMGVAVIGGTVTSTLLTLFVIPAVYAYMERFSLLVNTVIFRFLSKPSKKDLNFS